jgi:hypothetical protein
MELSPMSSSGGLWLFLVFVEACRLKGIKIQVAGNVGMDYLDVLKKDTSKESKGVPSKQSIDVQSMLSR